MTPHHEQQAADGRRGLLSAAAASGRPAQPAAHLGVRRVESSLFTAASAAPLAVAGRGRPGPILILRVRARRIVVDEASIGWIDGAGNYVRFHVGLEKHLVRGSLASLAGVLSPQFVRSHRSTIVNVAAIREFVRTPFGDLVVVLRTGDRLTVGRGFRRNVEAAFAGRL
ncbi:MAG TPA: LytTR family DNA-binding domain-containing protein [Thermoanaerobaculia bacterium]|nr:LytTR family DNA-binding domain-containing protein [Thermoanaerobaculia bacterium]